MSSDDERASLAGIIHGLSDVMKILVESIAHFQDVRLSVEELAREDPTLEEDETFFRLMSGRMLSLQIDTHALLAVLNLYMTGVCPTPEIIAAAFRESHVLPAQVDSLIQRIHDKMD